MDQESKNPLADVPPMEGILIRTLMEMSPRERQGTIERMRALKGNPIAEGLTALSDRGLLAECAAELPDKETLKTLAVAEAIVGAANAIGNRGEQA